MRLLSTESRAPSIICPVRRRDTGPEPAWKAPWCAYPIPGGRAKAESRQKGKVTQPAASTVSEQTALPSTDPKTSPKPRAPAAGAVTRSEERLLSAAGA